ncbi:MAG TPA: hypothetical protein VKF14_06535 [Candidatus Dormibacteraeota bacterium]|nr:hypothetical protein [Candidatus Dormibacteraeota bacterium]
MRVLLVWSRRRLLTLYTNDFRRIDTDAGARKWRIPGMPRLLRLLLGPRLTGRFLTARGAPG